MKRILVSGDVVVDNHLYVGERKTPRSAARGTRMARVWGGAKLTEKLLAALATSMQEERSAAVTSEDAKRKEKVAKEGTREGFSLTVLVDGEPVQDKGNPALWQVDTSAKQAAQFGVDFGLNILGEPCCTRNGSFSTRACANKRDTESCASACASTADAKDAPPPDAAEGLHCYATWEASPKDSDNPAWRVHEALGYGGGGGESFDFARLRHPSAKDEGAGKKHNILVLDDAGLGFRHFHGDGKKKTFAWPEVLRKESTLSKGQWVILKMLAPLCSGALWETLKNKRHRLIAVVSVDDIRREDARVSKAVSWERTATDLIRELNNNHRLRPLLECRHLIIPLRSEGALWFDNGTCPNATDRDGKQRWRLFFDNEHQEGEWPSDNHGREVFGFMSCLMTSLAAHLAVPRMTWAPKIDKLDKKKEIRLDFTTVTGETSDGIEWGILRGLAGMRVLQDLGHREPGKGKNGEKETKEEKNPIPGFPFKQVADAIAGNWDSKKVSEVKYDFADVPVPDEVVKELRSLGSSEKSEAWAILAQCDEETVAPKEMVERLARRVALNGAAELRGVPCGKYGKYVTPDRNEIEALQSLRRIVRQYKEDKTVTNPLSIAVFGQPGAGKSFAVKQLARELLNDPPMLTFNLSQFNRQNEENELVSALHQVRDKVLKGALPVVFWDEFDTAEQDWLKSFLAPMNDGEFVDGQITHPIGRCIFVFAGGCFHTMAAMRAELESDEERIKNKKGPDFISRLSGYFDVSGPNAREGARGFEDICFPVRRALLMRSVLKLKDRDELDIDRKLLMALLTTHKYLNASRSLERLLAVLRGGGAGRITQSSLPPRSDLELLIEKVDKFTDMLRPEQGLDAKALELAPQVHAWYCEQEVSKGHEAVWLRAFEKLRDDIQYDNFTAAKRMSALLKVRKVGLKLVPASTKIPKTRVMKPEKVKELLEKHLEHLAEMEHNGWMREKFLNGYRYAEIRDEVRRRHPALRPYKKLDKIDKDRDRNSVRRIPDFAEKAGFVFVKEAAPKPKPQRPTRTPQPKAPRLRSRP